VSENDVLQKLRDDEPNRQDLESVNPGTYNYLMNLAQDEIERLVAENGRLWTKNAELGRDLGKYKFLYESTLLDVQRYWAVLQRWREICAGACEGSDDLRARVTEMQEEGEAS